MIKKTLFEGFGFAICVVWFGAFMLIIDALIRS